jgi:hypothetical protein
MMARTEPLDRSPCWPKVNLVPATRPHIDRDVTRAEILDAGCES